MPRWEKVLLFAALASVIVFGLYIRFDDAKTWKERKDKFFLGGKPIYSAYDSFYFARLSEDIDKGVFKAGKIDNLRFFPDNKTTAALNKKKFYRKYAVSGYFVSFILEFFHRLFGAPYEVVTWYMVPILSVTLCIPLFFYFLRLGLPWAGVVGGLVGVSSPIFLGRTGLMRLDHDMLNLAIPFFAAYFMFEFFRSERKRRFLWAGLSSATLLFYQLWYGHSNLILIFILVFLFRLYMERGLRWGREDLISISILIIPQLWYIWWAPAQLYRQVEKLVFHIKSSSEVIGLFKDFPNISISISELQKLSFKSILGATTFNFPVSLVGFLGCIACFVLYFGNLLFLFPYFLIGLLSFRSGMRFIMYLAPFVGIGLGFLVHLAFSRVAPYFGLFKGDAKERLSTHIVGVLFLIFMIFFVQRPAVLLFSTPKVSPSVAKDMYYLRSSTEPGSAVWTWWDYGYAIQYYSRRATFHDGGAQGTPKTYFVARSFATSSFSEAWNVISFVSNYGLKGLADLIKGGLSAKDVVFDIRKGELSLPIDTPVYWVFTPDLVSKFSWIYYFGSYNFDRKRGDFIHMYWPKCKPLGKSALSCSSPSMDIDFQAGVIRAGGKDVPIRDVILRDAKKIESKHYGDVGVVVELVRFGKNSISVFVLDPPAFPTLFNRMYILREYDPKYFKLVLDDFPYMVVYRVKPLPGKNP